MWKFLGCPEPIIQEIKHHDIHDILPYHGYSGHDFGSFDGGYSGGYSSGYSGYPGFDGNAYSNTPPPSISSFGSAGSFGGSAPGISLGVPFSSASGVSPGSSDSSGPGPDPSPNAYLPPNRRSSVRGRAIDAQSAEMATDLVFRFLGVNTNECRKRFVCELEFRNPIVEHAMRFMG